MTILSLMKKYLSKWDITTIHYLLKDAYGMKSSLQSNEVLERNELKAKLITLCEETT